MDLEEVVPPSQVHLASGYVVKCSNCGFTSSLVADASSQLPLRSVMRKSDESQEGTDFLIPGLDPITMNPKVQVENEVTALREAISNQQQKIQDLYTELEEERDASSSAANEAMSMILRLQNEKAEVEMEAKQFKRFTEEKMVHDQQEIAMLEDLLYKREQAIHSLTCEVQAYKHRMLSYGFTEAEVEGARDGIDENFGDPSIEFAGYNYPPLKCNLIENPTTYDYEDEDYVDVEKYSFGETPRSQDHLKNLEHRIGQIEAAPNPTQLERNFSSTKSVLKKVIVGHSPRQPRHIRRFSADSSSSILCLSKEVCSDFDTESSCKYETGFRRMDFIPEIEDPSNWKKTDNASDFGDDMSDRVYYTVDYVQNAAPSNNNTPKKGIPEDNLSTPRNPFGRPDDGDPDIKKLYMRLQALEADRESLRQALISMRTDKAQMVLLKEIAQHLYREKTPERQTLVKTPSIVRSFSFISIVKWIFSLIFWRKKAHRSKYTFGLSASNVGMLMLLDKGPRMRQWRCLTRTQL